GTLQARLGDETHRLEAGDAIYFQATRAHEVRNVCEVDCQYFLVIDSTPFRRCAHRRAALLRGSQLLPGASPGTDGVHLACPRPPVSWTFLQKDAGTKLAKPARYSPTPIRSACMTEPRHTSPDATPRPDRRRALKLGALGGVGLAAPAIVVAQTAQFRCQSAWPAKAIFHEFAIDVCRNIEQATGGRVRIQMLPSGAVVPPLQLIDAVSKGTIDGGHAVPGFWFGRNTAFGLFGAGPHFGLDSNQTLGWVERGGGKELYAEVLAAAKLNVVSYLYGPVPTEPFGWF